MPQDFLSRDLPYEHVVFVREVLLRNGIRQARREGNDALKKRLDEVIEKHQAELTSILSASGVMVGPR